MENGTKRDLTREDHRVQRRRVRRRTLKPGQSYHTRLVEERIAAAQKEGAFDALPGKGKPLDLEDLNRVPQELRVAFHVLKNANMLPPELEFKKQIVSLQDLLAATGEEPEQHTIIKAIREKLIQVDILHRRSFGHRDLGAYGKKLIDKLRRR